jgi:hypothetical protein
MMYTRFRWLRRPLWISPSTHVSGDLLLV